MPETVIDTPPVIPRLARSKDHLFSSLFDGQHLTSKLSFLGSANRLGLFSSPRRIHPESNSTPPSFRDYLLLSGGGLEPASKIPSDDTSSKPARSASSGRNSSLTLKDSQASGTSINDFSDRETDAGPTDCSCPAPPLTPPATPTAERQEAPHSRASVFSVLASSLHPPRSRRGHSSGRSGTPSVADDCDRLQSVSIAGTLSSRMDLSPPPGVRARDGASHPGTIFEVKFSPPSFIRPRGRKLIARREPSPMIYSPSVESLKLNASARSYDKERRDEGIALSRSSGERDTIPEEDETIEEGQVSPLYHKARHNRPGQERRSSPDKELPCYTAQASHPTQVGPQRTRHVQNAECDQKPGPQRGQETVLASSPDDATLSEEAYMQKIACQIDSIVELAATDDSSRSDWRAYMENYSKGSFNISTPPVPPTASPKFQYLPAIFPRTEADRISVFNSHKLEWNAHTAKKLSDLLIAVMAKFGLNSGAISFFNNKCEYIKAERGYNSKTIARSDSMAAHGLLSADVFVVPDTEKDWRFQGHPLVVNHPRIRFFAGAPLLGDGGQPIGMLSVFSDASHPGFTPFDRRELADFAAQAMKNLISGSDHDHTSSGPAVSQFETASLVGADPECKILDVPELDNTNRHRLAPMDSSDCYIRPETPSTRFNNSLVSCDNSLRRLQHPFSRPSRSNLRGQNEFDKQKYDQYSGSGMEGGPTLYKLDALSISEYAPSSPRPFSSSDVSSIHKHPTNTPVHSQVGFPPVPELDFTLQLLRSLGAEYPEDAPDNDGRSFMSSNKTAVVSSRKRSPRTPTPDSPLSSRLPRLKDALTTRVLDDGSVMSATRPASREDARAEAALICSRTARRLGYDLIYAVELNPALDAIDETKIMEPGVLPISILAACGMNEPFRPDPQVHIDALRSKGFYYWQAPPNASQDTGGYHSGCLIAVPTQGGVQHLRTSGIVIGAFRKTTPGKGVTFETTDAELKALMDAGDEVKGLFWATPENSPGQARYRSQNGLMTEAYPAHEAVRVRVHPTNPYPRSPYSVNHQEKRSGSPYPYQKHAHKQPTQGCRPNLQGPARQLFSSQTSGSS